MFALIILLIAMSASAAPWVTGASGAPGLQSCASSCHGDGTGTLEIVGFPESYVPDSTYIVLLTSTGLPVKNFNASCRVGEGTLNAGMMIGDPDGHTVGYTLPEETNGIHAAVLDQDSLFFAWRAPLPGTGEVRLYVAAHQGQDTGPNSDFMLVATEQIIPQPPAVPSHPVPSDDAQGVAVSSELAWDEVQRADSFRIYFGTESPPPFVAAQTQIHFAPGALDHNTRYYWRIEAVNEVGTTSGPEWEFTTEVQSTGDPGPWVGNFMLYPPHPNPFNNVTRIAFDVIGPTPVRMAVFDVAGRLVTTLFDGVAANGRNEIFWQADGAAGVYFIRADIHSTPVVFKAIYLK